MPNTERVRSAPFRKPPYLTPLPSSSSSFLFFDSSSRGVSRELCPMLEIIDFKQIGILSNRSVLRSTRIDLSVRNKNANQPADFYVISCIYGNNYRNEI